MSRIQLSKNFYLDEFTLSQTAARHGIEIEVVPDSEVFYNLKRLCVDVLQHLRDALGSVTISSGYRPVNVNKLIGGSDTSAHVLGLAADITVAGYTPLEVCKWIQMFIKNYDQVIHEFGRWTHIGLSQINKTPRKQSLTAFKSPKRRMRKQKTIYIQGLLHINEAQRMAA